MKISILKLEWKRREGGGGATERDFLDFIVDGESLFEKIGGDMISPLGWLTPEENTKAVNRLMLKEEAELPDNRNLLYVCPECAHISCGAITAVIERKDDNIIWRDFGYQNSYETEIYPVENINSFTFERVQYRNALREAIQSE